jgi:hypothetical protein
MDGEKFRKVLAKTGSSSDNEVLAFIRKANDMLKEDDLTWGDLDISIGRSGNKYQKEDFRHKKMEKEIEELRHNVHELEELRQFKINVNRDVFGMIQSLAKMHTFSKGFAAFLCSFSYKLLHGNLTDDDYNIMKCIFEDEMKEKSNNGGRKVRSKNVTITDGDLDEIELEIDSSRNRKYR